MAYNIKLGTIAKHEESTMQPNTTLWDSYDVVFKEGTDIVSPTITISGSLATISGYNYGYMLGRYYWIRGITAMRNDYVVLELETDVLATYKSQIGDTRLYILRASAAADGTIRDEYYPIKAKPSHEAYTIRGAVSNTLANGVFVINVAGQQTGSSTLIELSPASFTDLIRSLMVTVDGLSWSDIPDAIKNLLFKPMDYINSVMWYPESFGGDAINTIKIGCWAANIPATIIKNPVKTLSVTSNSPTIFKHPQAASRGKYLNLAPYSNYSIEYGPFGIIGLDSSMMVDATYVSITGRVDALTGIGHIRGTLPEINDEPVLFSVSAQYGVQVPLLMNAAGGSVGSFLGSAAGIAAAVVSGNPAAIAGAAAGGIGTIENAITGSTTNIGSNGSVVAHNLPRYLHANFYEVADADNTHHGRPYCKVAKPSTLGGFMMVSKGDVDIPGTLPEQQRIRSFLESGFYYE